MTERAGPGRDLISRIKDGMADRIARDGYDVVNVFGDPELKAYSYTVGLTDRGLPELIVTGFQTSLMQRILHDSVPKADTIRDGDILTKVITLPLGIRRVPQDAADRFLLAARSHYGRPVEGLQIVIPDAAGRFPWQPGCDPIYVRYQSDLIPFATERRASH